MVYLKLAWRNIWRKSRRTWITIASIFFSVILAFGMSSLQFGTYQNMIENTVRFYTGYIQIHAKGYWEERSLNNSFALTDSLKQSIQPEEIAGLKEYVPRLEAFALASSGELTRGALIMGIDPEKENYLMDPAEKLVKGNFKDFGEKSILLTSGLAEQLRAKTGDTIVVLGQGYHGIRAAGKYHVQGLIEIASPELNNQLLLMNLPEAQWLFGAENRITSLSVIATSYEEVPRVEKELKQRLSDVYEVMNWREMNPGLVQAIEADRASGLILLLILYLVIGFGILGTVIMMTMEREHEFGILISIGMKRIPLIAVLILEIFMIAATAILLGLLVGYPVLLYLNENPIQLQNELREIMLNFGFEPVMPFSLEAKVFTQQTLVVLGISLLTALYPVYYVSRLKEVEAIRD